MAVDRFQEWKAKATNFDMVEWIFGIDESDEITRAEISSYVFHLELENVRLAINRGHQSCTAAINKCAQVSKGDILVDVCDDVGCPDGWDNILREIIPEPLEQDVFLRCGDGQSSELCPHPIISRKRYEMLGYFMHPDFNPFHSFGDEDATLRARKDGSMIERLDIVFEHRHPAFGKGEWDDAYKKASNETGAAEVLWKHHPEKKPI